MGAAPAGVSPAKSIQIKWLRVAGGNFASLPFGIGTRDAIALLRPSLRFELHERSVYGISRVKGQGVLNDESEHFFGR